MKCPIDQTDLRPTDRQGIEVDYCPTCRGIWLDRGELDKVVERSAVEEPGWGADEERYERGAAPGRRSRKRSLLGELFDFG